MNSRHALLITVALAAASSGCSPVMGERPGHFPATVPPPVANAPSPDGGIWHNASAMTLFDDQKARRVGDTLTIQLAERTQASKSASTDAAKDTKVDTGAPTLFGDTVTRNGEPILSNDWETSQQFDGSGSSSQSNQLEGNITVTVAEVLPNGNLLVRGEKWLTLNQGEEYVQITGIVRPTDISANNSIPSYKVADARITYSGNGVIPDANRPGLLARLFIKLWPL